MAVPAAGSARSLMSQLRLGGRQTFAVQTAALWLQGKVWDEATEG
jgi:hypothetical protein